MKHLLSLLNTTSKLSPTAHYLGIVLDQQLRWWQHIQYIKGKAASTLQALRLLTGSTWGSGLVALQQAYTVVVVPQILYGCSIWYHPRGTRGHTDRTRKALDRIQLKAARIISGAYRATSAPALNVEVSLLPIYLQLEKRALQTAINIQAQSLDPNLRNL
jgi:hypothetical protein